MVSLPFHQIVRSICPLITILIYRIVYHQKHSTEVYLCLIPLICGIAITTYGDYYFTIPGFLLSATGVILASIKVRCL
jgi:cytochrome c oxidase subunit IV